MTFGFIPSDYVLSKFIPTNSVAKIDDGQFWNNDVLGYLEQSASGTKNISFSVRAPYQFPEGRHSIISGIYNGSDVSFALVYENSEASYDAGKDSWEGTLKVKSVLILAKSGEILKEVSLKPSLTLRFQSHNRVK